VIFTSLTLPYLREGVAHHIHAGGPGQEWEPTQRTLPPAARTPSAGLLLHKVKEDPADRAPSPAVGNDLPAGGFDA
jgi:hypothetical protein